MEKGKRLKVEIPLFEFITIDHTTYKLLSSHNMECFGSNYWQGSKKFLLNSWSKRILNFLDILVKEKIIKACRQKEKSKWPEKSEKTHL